MKKTLIWSGIILLTATAVLLSYSLFSSAVENPFLTLGIMGNEFFDKPSPANWIQENKIMIYPDKVVIFVTNATLSRYSNTKSMDPVLDFTSNGIEIKPRSPEDIHVGDIISYEKGSDLIVHRVIEIGTDEQGWFCITKGDNALQNDGKVRFKEIKYVTIAIVY
ncbi:MAG: hypothetical protein N3G19_02735 [Candidatus Pacearchaeota archaeon]|nr:hypothetical protein [Candidatus Pacearchaeota archaeon]